MTRTLFIGLDGATFTVLDDLTGDKTGRGVVMPFLKNLIETGYRADLRSTALPLTPPAWVTILTGRNPGAHGVFDFMRTKDKGDDVFFTLNEFRDIRVETIWSLLSRQERTMVSLNFPMMAPPPDVNGSLIPGFTSWKHLRRNMTPSSLYERLKKIPDFNLRELAWDFDRENEIGLEMNDDKLTTWIGYHLPREDQWYRIAEKMIREDRPDLMAVMFDGMDKIQHQAWKYIDPSLQPDAPDPSHSALRTLCLDYFSRLDGYLEGLVAAAGPDVRVFLVSDHGFTVTDKVVRINRYLGELGYLHWREAPNTDAGRRRESSPFAYLDWRNTVAYCPTPSSNGIIIRVKQDSCRVGIAPHDYHGFRDKLMDELYQLEDPTSGRPIIRKVLTREEAFPGPAMKGAPDLTLVLDDYGFVSIKNLEPCVVSRNYPLGTHHPDGIFVAWGDGVKDGEAGEPLEVADMAATFLYSLDLPIPQDLEGKVAKNCFSGEYLAGRPVKTGPPTLSMQDGGGEEEGSYSSEDKQEILKRLRMLGYME